MSTSSARRPSYLGVEGTDAPEIIDGRSDVDASRNVRGTPSSLVAPRFDDLSGVRAQTARMAGRINAAGVSKDEHHALLRERQALLDKKLSDGISRRELNRLEYVRWSLDRIEDARHGQALDLLEGYVTKYEDFLSELRRFGSDLLLAATKK